MDEAKNLLWLRGKSGRPVADIKKALGKALGEDKAIYPGLAGGDEFDADTVAALRAWQAGVGLVADGIAGPRCLLVLGISSLPAPPALNTALVCKLFPHTKPSSIARNLPYVAAALSAFGLDDADMIGMALATIRAETEGFVPIAELPSHFNTLPGQAPFGAYDRKLGNKRPGDGARYRGRGYVQLTGCDNYLTYGTLLDLPLGDDPDCACAPEIAACLLAAYLDANRDRLVKALARDDLKEARRVVNGGSHGLDRFSETFRAARAALTAPAAAAAEVGRTAAPFAARRATVNVKADPADLRDRPYQPPPRSLPALFPADEDIGRYIGVYSSAGLVLDQGQEGACTGFGLACVINFLRWRAAGMPEKFKSVSPRMLYHFARRYDEYEGENYAGSSCRGALKGWHHNGVCLAGRWRYQPGVDTLPAAGWDSEAAEQTLGVYYRIDPQAITDLQAAIHEVGAIYVSAYTHPGWETVRARGKPPKNHAGLPVIDYDGTPSREGGHAFALVGFNRIGFVIQNSWGGNWGAGGFAVIRYADWLAHAMDAWVAAMGVPGVIAGRLASSGLGRTATAATAGRDGWWDEARAYRHSIVLGNNGRIERFDTIDGIARNLQTQACIAPDAWFRQNRQEPKRLVIYAHGGLNSEKDAIARAQAMGRYFLGNGCYPLFMVWKSGLLESLADILADRTGRQPAGLAGAGLADRLSDPLIEKTIGRPFARPLWSEMKENAELAAESGRGGDLLTEALRSLAGTWGDRLEVHLIGHSAGSILLGRLLGNLAQKRLDGLVQSVHLYAPACTVAFANRHYAPYERIMKRLYVDILSDGVEQDDNVALVYRKSLLYLVSNALEADPRTPLLGLAKVYDPDHTGWDGSPATAEHLGNWRNAAAAGGLAERLTVHAEERIVCRRGQGLEKTAGASHGGFDNNVDIVGRTLERITGSPLQTPVVDLTGF
jgi:predicted chitinase